MSEEDVNIGNPFNNLHDEEERNAPHVTQIPPEAQADDLFDDTVIEETATEDPPRGHPDPGSFRPENPRQPPHGVDEPGESDRMSRR